MLDLSIISLLLSSHAVALPVLTYGRNNVWRYAFTIKLSWCIQMEDDFCIAAIVVIITINYQELPLTSPLMHYFNFWPVYKSWIRRCSNSSHRYKGKCTKLCMCRWWFSKGRDSKALPNKFSPREKSCLGKVITSSAVHKLSSFITFIATVRATLCLSLYQTSLTITHCGHYTSHSLGGTHRVFLELDKCTHLRTLSLANNALGPTDVNIVAQV